MYYTKKLWAAGGGGEVVLNFVPFVAPESFNDPSKYADFGCTVNLHEKLRIYKMTYPGADIAVEFSDAIENVAFTSSLQLGAGAMIEIFETISGEEISALITVGQHWFTPGSTKRYMIRRIPSEPSFDFPVGSVWAYCYGTTYFKGDPSPYLKYIFFHEYKLTALNLFRDTAITGTLTINGGVTNKPARAFIGCNNLTKVITGDSVSTIGGGSQQGAFYQCGNLQIVDLGTGVTSIGQDAFASCTSLNVVICRAYNPPTLYVNAFSNIPETTKFYVPHERVAMYKNVNGWMLFASRIYSINDL